MIDKKAELQRIDKEIKRCKICKSFGKGKMVSGEGNPDAKIVFVGEAPGKEESIKGVPFIGRSGRFLRETISSLGIKEEEIFITSPVKYMPLSGTPTKENIIHSRRHLLKQLSIIKPKIIVLLGSVACFALLEQRIKVSEIHGKIIKKDDISYLITFHPAYAMRFPDGKKKFIEDLEKLKNYINSRD